jgi:hypothetical protein
LGWLAVKLTHWTLILVLLGTVLCASAVLRTDDPETLVNEADVSAAGLSRNRAVSQLLACQFLG